MAMHDDDTIGEEILEDAFQRLRHASPELPERLAAQMLRDADASSRTRRQSESGSFLDRLKWLLGGWPGLGTLTVSCMAGFWLGIAPPAALPDPAGLFGVGETVPDILAFGTFEDFSVMMGD